MSDTAPISKPEPGPEPRPLNEPRMKSRRNESQEETFIRLQKLILVLNDMIYSPLHTGDEDLDKLSHSALREAFNSNREVVVDLVSFLLYAIEIQEKLARPRDTHQSSSNRHVLPRIKQLLREAMKINFQITKNNAQDVWVEILRVLIHLSDLEMFENEYDELTTCAEVLEMRKQGRKELMGTLTQA